VGVIGGGGSGDQSCGASVAGQEGVRAWDEDEGLGVGVVEDGVPMAEE
jgi:hypothetical protein